MPLLMLTHLLIKRDSSNGIKRSSKKKTEAKKKVEQKAHKEE